MSQPPGFLDSLRPHHVCKLKKAIYDLKQAPRAWYTELTNFLSSLGFQRAISDTLLFMLYGSQQPIFLIVYVDDIIVTDPHAATLIHFITTSSHRFALKDLCTLSYFLGVEVIPTPHGLFLNQR